ncbi:gamma carbonic anhydrase family protein [Oleispirillum naphthae]|uniref:gamma carbonic anhydrase family protein n=1 Tax=Oleispirillum naphthae TaxID=2838853 RepID=UPI00308267A8
MAAIVLPYKGVSPDIHPSAFVAPGVAVLGDVVIGEDTNIWFGCVLRGDVDVIRIGKRTNIQDGTIVHLSRDAPTIIGDDVTVGHGAILHGCVLKDRAFVGMGATVLDGAVVEGMLGAGALLTQGKRVPAGELWAGSPARFLRKLTAEEIEGFVPHAWHYVELARRYKTENGL